MEIASWSPISYSKSWWIISRFPKTDRIKSIVKFSDPSIMDNMKHDDQVNCDFFNQVSQLFHDTPSPNMRNKNAENSDYSDVVVYSKNAYLSNTVINWCENVIYSISIKDNSTNIIDSMMVWNNCSNIFTSKNVINSYNVFYSKNIHNSSDIWFSTNLIWCHNCIWCDSLENKTYHINNNAYTKDQFDEELKKLSKNQFIQNYTDVLKKKTTNLLCEQTNGISNIECENLDNWYYCYNVKNGKNLFLHGSALGSEYAYDCYTWWSPQVKNFYAVNASWNGEYYYCCVGNDWGSNMFYSINCDNCSFCLGCIWLKNKSYCILNKQYTKEERYEKVDEIFSQMEQDGTLGEFFPATMNPFYFNDTAAYLIDPTFTKEEVTAKWYLRRDEPIKVDIPEGMDVVQTTELDQYEWYDNEWNRTINADILKKVIQDEQGNVYRIIPMEYKFLVKHWLPLPRKHRLERMKENFRIQ